MSDRTGADVTLEALVRLEVGCVFVVASVHNLPILRAIRRHGGIRVVNMRHEQAAVHAADGYARASGGLGVAITSTGPGAANAMGGLFEAAFASSRVLMLTGQVETGFLGRGRGFIHEAERQADMLRSVAPHTWSVRRVEDLGDAVLAAGRAVRSGRPQPATVEIPVDLQYAGTSVPVPAGTPALASLPRADRLDEAAQLLATARRPVLWAGGGVISAGAWPQLAALAERLSIPVVTSTAGRGALPEDHPLSMGCLTTEPAVRAVIESADVLLAVGTRFQMYQTDHWRMSIPAQLVHVDVDASVIGRTYPARVSVVGDAGLALSGIDERVDGLELDPGWVVAARDAAGRARSAARAAIGPDHCAILDAIRKHLPRGAAIVRDCTVPAYYWGDTLLPVLVPRTSMNPTSAAIGPGLPLAVGAVAALGQRSVVIHGDGGLMLTVAELATVAQFGLPLTVCVFVDGGYGVLRGIQQATFGPGAHDVDLPAPDFVQLAQAMGVPGRRVSSAAAFEEAFAASVQRAGPYLIEVDLTALTPMQITEQQQLLLG